MTALERQRLAVLAAIAWDRQHDFEHMVTVIASTAIRMHIQRTTATTDPPPPIVDVVVTEVAQRYGIQKARIYAHSNSGTRSAKAFSEAVWICRNGLMQDPVGFSALGRAFGLHQATIRLAVGRYEAKLDEVTRARLRAPALRRVA